jgi:hypothetical protein
VRAPLLRPVHLPVTASRRRAGRAAGSSNRPSSPAPLLRLALVLTAAAFVLTPPPADLVERWYAGGLYPHLQAGLTTVSNLLPFAMFDVVVVLGAATPLVLWGLAIRRGRLDGSWRSIRRASWLTLVLLSGFYVWFLLAWGFNYARPPIDVRLALGDRRITTDEVRRLALQAVALANENHAAAHAAGFPADRSVPAALVEALHEVDGLLGRPRPTVAGRPKPSLFAWFFRAAGVDGMLAPFALETLLNPALTPPERPFVLAHEWAHLAGHADEAEASFVAWLVTMRADVPSLYSGWLYVTSESLRQLPAGERDEVIASLAPGPRADLEAITARAATVIAPVHRTSWRAYDRYLRTQGVDDGVRSYSRGLELIVRYGAR